MQQVAIDRSIAATGGVINMYLKFMVSAMVSTMQTVEQPRSLPPINTGIARQITCLAAALTADLGDNFRLYDSTPEQVGAQIREFLKICITSGALGRFYVPPVGDNVAIDVICRALQTGARLMNLAMVQHDTNSRLSLLDNADTRNIDAHNWPLEEIGGAY